MTTTRFTSQQDARRHATTGVVSPSSLQVQPPTAEPAEGPADHVPPGPKVGEDITVRIKRESTTGQPMLQDEGRWVRHLRHIAARKLRNWGLHPLLDDAELLISELVTNALKHGTGGEVVFRLVVTGDVLLIEVDDGSPHRPRVRAAGVEDENGRGMLIVSELATEWGVSPDGTNTWCTVALANAQPDTITQSERGFQRA